MICISQVKGRNHAYPPIRARLGPRRRLSRRSRGSDVSRVNILVPDQGLTRDIPYGLVGAWRVVERKCGSAATLGTEPFQSYRKTSMTMDPSTITLTVRLSSRLEISEGLSILA